MSLLHDFINGFGDQYHDNDHDNTDENTSNNYEDPDTKYVSDEPISWDINAFDITSKGFLPDTCVRDLPEQFIFYQPVLDNLSETDAEKNGNYFRDVVHRLPKYDKVLYDIADLTMGEIKFLYSILSMIVHRYMWCDGSDKCVSEIPPEIGKPWYQASKRLGIRCVLTHAAVDLYNWRLIDETKPFSLDNITTNYTMTGKYSESWFYMIMIAIEGMGGQMFSKFVKLSELMKNKDNDQILEILVEFNTVLTDIKTVIKRTYENCDSDVFFKQLRIYLHGSRKAPNGKIVIKADPTDDTDHDIDVSESGGSAAQSSLIQVFDSIFGTKHSADSLNYLKEQRHFMPEQHRTFVECMNYTSNVRDYIMNSDDNRLISAYNKCNSTFVKFRQVHFSLTGYYIAKYIDNGGEINYEDLKSMCGANPSQNSSANGKCPMTNNIGKCPISGNAVLILKSHDKSDTNDYVKKYVFTKPSKDMIKAEGSGETDFRVFLPDTIRNTIMNDIPVKNRKRWYREPKVENNEMSGTCPFRFIGFTGTLVVAALSMFAKWYFW